jgi:hypothetical protein
MSKEPINVDRLTSTIAGCPETVIRPKAFFVSWHGVMTLVYEGFSKSILDVKTELESLYPFIPKENEGSKWSKTTLGALKQGCTLTLKELEILRNLCTEHDDSLAGPEDFCLIIDSLNYVDYECRSLERISNCNIVHLKHQTPPEYDLPHWHKTVVDSVLSQFSRENMATYLEKVQKDGHREPHYRSYKRGSSLIFKLPSESRIFHQIEKIIADVDASLPDRYIWFLPGSHHVTIRAL